MQLTAGEGIRSPFTCFCGLSSFDAGVKSRIPFLPVAQPIYAIVYTYTDYQCLPNYPSGRLLRSLVFSNTCTCSFDLEQTSLSFSTLAPLFSMFARCLVHGSVAPTFRRGVGSLQFEGPWACDAVSQVSSTRRETKKGAKRRGYGDTGVRSRRNSRTSFLDGRTWGEES